MRITIEPVRSLSDLAELMSLHQAVFGSQAEILPGRPRARPPQSVMHLAARRAGTPGIIAALSVIDTTGDHVTHLQYGLSFPPGAKVARYTRPAILAAYRTLNLPLQMLRQAARLFVTPRGIQFTWLDIGAATAAWSDLAADQGYRAEPGIHSEDSTCRILVRDERAFPAPLSIVRVPEIKELCKTAS